jgi:hypothetical protein
MRMHEKINALLLVMGLSGVWAGGCAQSDDTPSTPTAESPQSAESASESRTTALDDNLEARAMRLEPDQTLVEIRRRDGSLVFDARYSPEPGQRTRVSYTLHPTDHGEPSEPVSSELMLEPDQQPSIDQAVDGAVLIHSQLANAISGNYDNWGCDLLPGRWNAIASCGLKGGCCDTHDACYKRHGCTASSWRRAPWNTCQLRCNAPAVACFVSSWHPGPSQCCFRRNCGRPR